MNKELIKALIHDVFVVAEDAAGTHPVLVGVLRVAEGLLTRDEVLTRLLATLGVTVVGDGPVAPIA